MDGGDATQMTAGAVTKFLRPEPPFGHSMDMTFRWISLTLLLCAACQKSGASAPATTAKPSSGQVVAVSVTEKGFEPDHIEAAPSQPLVLRFTRKVDPTCADAVQVQGDEVRHMLPLNQAVDVKVNVPKSGELAFACPMDMYRGAIQVVAGH
ncbi:MAG: cupredoxin domain-containing protein [Myxococcales bacterium]